MSERLTDKQLSAVQRWWQEKVTEPEWVFQGRDVLSLIAEVREFRAAVAPSVKEGRSAE